MNEIRNKTNVYNLIATEEEEELPLLSVTVSVAVYSLVPYSAPISVGSTFLFDLSPSPKSQRGCYSIDEENDCRQRN